MIVQVVIMIVQVYVMVMPWKIVQVNVVDLQRLMNVVNVMVMVLACVGMAVINVMLPIVLINQADNRQRGRQTYEAIAKACHTFLGFRPPLAGIITRDPKVRECLRSQTPIMDKYPTAQAALDASQVAESLIRGWEITPMPEEQPGA